MSSSSQRDGAEVRPLWVLPDADSLALLINGPHASASRGGVAMVAEVQGPRAATSLVLAELSDLDATELIELLRGNPRFIVTRLTMLPETIDRALACLAPSLVAARRVVLEALDRVNEDGSLTISALDLAGGTVECARIESLRLYPECRVTVPVSERSGASDGGAASSEVELTESLGILNAHPAHFRPVIETAIGRDELDRLRPLLQELSKEHDRGVGSFAGRVLVRAAPASTRPDPPRYDAESPVVVLPREGTPAARALKMVAAVPAYRQGRSAQGAGAAGKLSSNESPFGPPPAVRAALGVAAENLNRYPEEGPVLDKFATYLGIDAERLVLTNGSDELCYLLARLMLDEVPDSSEARHQGFTVVGDPCYQIDATASTLAGAPIVRVPLVDGAHDLAAMARAACEGATLVWLPSPHNPTGIAVAPNELVSFLDEVPGDCLVVLDEAYSGFIRGSDPAEALRISESRPNLLVQRTFSKDWGLAGLRVGYAVGDVPLIGALRRARPPFSVNSLALAAVTAAMDCEDWRTTLVSRIVNERALLESTLDELGVTYFPSQANFVTCALAFPALRDALTAEGLSVRDGADLGLPGWTRITVGWAPQMAALRDVLRRHVETT